MERIPARAANNVPAASRATKRMTSGPALISGEIILPLPNGYHDRLYYRSSKLFGQGRLGTQLSNEIIEVFDTLRTFLWLNRTMKELAFLKLGGSLITDKTQPYTPRLDVIEDVALQISTAL